jgi:protein ImuB
MPDFPERPLWLLPSPHPLESRDGLPWWHGPLKLEGERERISAGWWSGRGVSRDYFVARCEDGSRLWVFLDRKGEKRWFLQGYFG